MYISHRFLCYFLLLVLYQGLECDHWSFGSYSNLPAWFKQICVWTLLFTQCHLLWTRSSSTCYSSNSYPYIVCKRSNNYFSSVSISIFSNISLFLSIKLALPSRLCWLLSRLLQGWDRTWNIWLPLVFSTNITDAAINYTSSSLAWLCLWCSSYMLLLSYLSFW